ncbi:lysozyme [Enterobacteriaceae bacterium YMB-R22]|jgi:lysozyme|uniref:lysozyme n=1 Tax=Tenebrionicola larvae TaxID=2815733 RepID=UPI0020133426|nr:lysozyme [Tenebrionicola larvae]MBV4411701.1 lysozyme [Tenebrionicola larvae]
MKISEQGLALIKRFEGYSLKAYPDPATGGAPWTIGYGWTKPVNGIPVQPGMTITAFKAEQLLRCGIVSYEQALNKLIKVPVTQAQFDAMISLAWNIGTMAFSTSTLLKCLNQKNYRGAAEQFLYWNRAGDKIMPGLQQRRIAEQRLFLS